MAMNNRERILAVLDRKSPDRVPWIARLDLWYHARMAEGNVPAHFRGMSLVEVGRALRTGNPARDGKIFTVRYEGLEVRAERAPGVARQRFIKATAEYNTLVRSFPYNLTAMMFGYKPKAQFTVEDEKAIAKPPTVDFGTKK